MNSHRRLLALVALAGGLAFPAAAVADSLVYTKDHNVWLANADGSGQVRVTTDGTAANPWTDPSQADDGTIVAARAKPNGGPLQRLRQNGEIVNAIPLPAMQAGPFSPALSPDGRLVAYEHVFGRYVNGWLETGSDIRYAKADGSGGTEQWPGVSTGATAPSWIDGSTVLAGRGAVAFTQRPGTAATQWWSDYDHWSVFGAGADLSDGEAAGGRVVMVRGGAVDGNAVVVYSAAGGAGATPSYLCTISDPAAGPNGRRFADPTLSADGRRVFTQQGDGIYVATASAGDGCDGWSERKLIDGAQAPDWGPANVAPTPRRAAGAVPARCLRLRGAKRAVCVTNAKRARAIATCKRTKRGRALARCLRAARRIR